MTPAYVTQERPNLGREWCDWWVDWYGCSWSRMRREVKEGGWWYTTIWTQEKWESTAVLHIQLHQTHGIWK